MKIFQGTTSPFQSTNVLWPEKGWERFYFSFPEFRRTPLMFCHFLDILISCPIKMSSPPRFRPELLPDEDSNIFCFNCCVSLPAGSVGNDKVDGTLSGASLADSEELLFPLCQSGKLLQNSTKGRDSCHPLEIL